jgi:ribose/xylose/arabinose/galactoside ABC-type transport system permease subunit
VKPVPATPGSPARLAAVGTFALQHLPWLLAGLILATTVLLVPAFQRGGYWLSLSQQYFPVAVLALALTPIVLTGGIDLSVGSVTVFVSVVIAVLLREAAWPAAAALAAGALAGLLAGLLNGTLVTLGVVPLVATLATRELFRGLAFTVSGEQGVTDLPDSLPAFWETPVLGLPPPLVVAGALAVATWFLVHHTWVGRMAYAVGDNEEAARYAGVPVRRLKLGLYAASGLLAGVCGAASVLQYGTAKADADKDLELTAIACVVLGGVRITGGSGHVAGTVLGVVTVATLLAGLNRVPPNGRAIALGALLVVVAVSNEAARRWAARRALSSPPGRPG